MTLNKLIEKLSELAIKHGEKEVLVYSYIDEGVDLVYGARVVDIDKNGDDLPHVKGDWPHGGEVVLIGRFSRKST